MSARCLRPTNEDYSGFARDEGRPATRSASARCWLGTLLDVAPPLTTNIDGYGFPLSYSLAVDEGAGTRVLCLFSLYLNE